MVTKQKKVKRISSKRMKSTSSSVITRTGVEIVDAYCRKCMLMKPAIKFYEAVDVNIDANGKMSICKDCIDEMYDKHYAIESNIDRTIYDLCRILNIAYMEHSVEATKNQLLTYVNNGRNTPRGIFGIYKGKLSTDGAVRGENSSVALTFSEPSKESLEKITRNSLDDIEYLRKFWGEGLTDNQYDFLENELSRYKRTHKCDTASEESLLRQIAFAEMDIKEARAQGRSPDSGIKRLQDLMKSAAIDPSKANVAGGGRSMETFSSFVKLIEENEPADYYKDKGLFKDYDNIGWYFKKFLTRPLKNFITNSRDFSLESNDSDDEFEDEGMSTDDDDDDVILGDVQDG